MVEMWIAEAMVKFAAGEALGQIFDQNNASNLDNVKRWIDEAVGEIKKFVSEELKKQLDDQYVNELQTGIYAVVLDLIRYDSHKPHDRKILDLRMPGVIDLRSATQRRRFAGVTLYADVVGLELLIYTAFVKNHNDKGYKALIDSLITTAAGHISECLSESTAWEKAGTESVVIHPIWHGCPPKAYGGRYSWRGGEEFLCSDDYQTIEGWQATKAAQRVAMFQDEWRLVVSEVHNPLRAAIEEWIKGQSAVTGKPKQLVGELVGSVIGPHDWLGSSLQPPQFVALRS